VVEHRGGDGQLLGCVLLGAASFGFFYLVWTCFRTFVAFEGDQFSTRSIFQAKVTARGSKLSTLLVTRRA
jgi:hypothetical protein